MECKTVSDFVAERMSSFIFTFRYFVHIQRSRNHLDLLLLNSDHKFETVELILDNIRYRLENSTG